MLVDRIARRDEGNVRGIGSDVREDGRVCVCELAEVIWEGMEERVVDGMM